VSRRIIRNLLLFALLLASCSGERDRLAIDRLKPCSAAEGPADGYCGKLDVWEDRQAKSGRKIALEILVLPALKQESARDPLFILAGGPGQGAAALADLLQEEFRPIESGRDIVLVDQRGTGKSNPLDCKEADDRDDSPAARAAWLRVCHDSYKGRADVTKYTTEIAMDDLDDVRAFLGYSRIDLYGASYGTRAAIVYARRHSDHTRAVILDGVSPTDMRLPLYLARDSQRALDLLFRDCEKDADCRRRFPNLRQRLETLLVRLGAHPQHTRYVHPRTGLEKEMDVTRLTMTSILFAALYSPKTAALVPLMIEQAEQGNFSSSLALRAAYDPTWKSIARGMHFSVLCSEDAPRIEAGSVQREAAGTFLGTAAADTTLEPCQFWPRAPIDAGYYANAPSDLPALILSGDLDPVTPPSWGQDVASQWRNSRHIIVPATGHGTSSSGCVMKVMTRFLDDGNASKLDASCVERLKRPPFFLGPSGPSAQGEVAK